MIKNRLSEIMGIKRMNRAELSRLSGVSNNQINKIYYDKTRGVDFETLNKLCWALDCNTQDLFRYVPDR